MYGVKCSTDVPMASASNSHGSHFRWWVFSLKLKNSAGNRCPFLMTNSVAPIPLFIGEASTVSTSLSDGQGIVNVLVSFSEA